MQSTDTLGQRLGSGAPSVIMASRTWAVTSGGRPCDDRGLKALAIAARGESSPSIALPAAPLRQKPAPEGFRLLN
jgi:hypothetical protein